MKERKRWVTCEGKWIKRIWKARNPEGNKCKEEELEKIGKNRINLLYITNGVRKEFDPQCKYKNYSALKIETSLNPERWLPPVSLHVMTSQKIWFLQIFRRFLRTTFMYRVVNNQCRREVRGWEDYVAYVFLQYFRKFLLLWINKYSLFLNGCIFC